MRRRRKELRLRLAEGLQGHRPAVKRPLEEDGDASDASLPSNPGSLRWLGAGVPAPATSQLSGSPPPPEGRDILLSASWSRRLKSFKAGQLEEKMVTEFLIALRKREKTGSGASARNAKRARAPGTLNLDVGSRISRAQTLKTFLLVSERLRKAGKKPKKYGEFAGSFRTAYCTLLADKELAKWCPQEAQRSATALAASHGWEAVASA